MIMVIRGLPIFRHTFISMKTIKLRLLISAVFVYQFALSQVTDNFNDGNFTANPAWTASNNADWMVNAAGQLQSNYQVANSTFYLSTQSTLATTTQWEFYTRLNFSTSSANYVDVYLTASAADLSNNSTTGYFVRIGNTDDEISLYRKDASGVATEIIDGVNGITNGSDNVFRIKVIRAAGNIFTLFRDAGATGTYISEGSATDATYTTSAYFGIFVRQSIASFFQKHYFDDVVVQPYNPDVTPPSIQSVTATSANTLDILFSEPVSPASAQTTANYSANNGIGSPQTAQIDAANNALVHLTFGTSFPNGITSTLMVNGVEDVVGNSINNGTATFSFYVPQRFDVVIDEIMADPTPVIRLPNAEYIEIKNVSGRTLNLTGWRLSSTAATSSAFPAYTLPADSFLIITSTSGAANFTTYGRTLGIGSFPALDNDGTTLSVISREGRTIHAVSYTKNWYQNPAKSDGGWSLEMIDTRNPCSGMSNWKASTDASGGTPGRKNSVDGVNNDQTPPALQNAYLLDNTTIILTFNEPLDSLSGAAIGNYSLTPSIPVVSASPLGPTFSQVQLKLGAPLSASTVYTITVTGVTDCKGNAMGTQNKASIGLPQDAAKGDMVVNEILFNPRPNSVDYVEFYNRSNKILDASRLYIANRNSAGTAGSLKKLSETPYYIFPGAYVVVTEDAASLQQQYLVSAPAAVLTVSSLPSFLDNAGTVVLLNLQGDVIDEVAYADDWHFELIRDDEGVSLERIDPDGVSQDKNNWHSAASTAGYGTPGYKNSQYKLTGSNSTTIQVTPKVFSPDNDGLDDIATIEYGIGASGYIANITIFDAAGRLVRHLVKNGTLGLKGNWNWDGLDERGQKLPIGTYIIYTELFNLQGKKERFKNTVVLARRLN